MRLQFQVLINGMNKHTANFQNHHKAKIPPNWSNTKKVTMYLSLVTEKLSEISPICVNSLSDCDIQYVLDQRLEQINSILVTATKESGCIYPQRF